MEYETARKLTRWLCLTALFVILSTPPVKSSDPVRIRPIDASLQGADPLILTFNCLNGQPGDTISLIPLKGDATGLQSVRSECAQIYSDQSRPG